MSSRSRWAAGALAIGTVVALGCEGALDLEAFRAVRSLPPSPLGAACEQDSECESAVCVDDVCCEMRCMTCSSCSAEGECVELELGSSDAPACLAPAQCDGRGGCASGADLWATTVSGAGVEHVLRLALAPEGCTAFALRADGSALMGRWAAEGNGGSDVLVGLLDASGEPIWVERLGGTGDEFTEAVTAHADGSVVVGGIATGGLTIDGQEPYDPIGMNDGFVARFAASGAFAWAQLIGGPEDDEINALAAGARGTTFVGGAVRALALGAQPLDLGCGDGAMTPDSQDLFALALDAGGECRWSMTDKVPGNQRVFGVAASPDDGVVITGRTVGPLSFVGTGTSDGDGSAFVLELDADGMVEWAHLFVGEGNASGYAVALTSDGRVHVGGNFEGSLELFGDDTTRVTAVGASNGFLATFSSEGVLAGDIATFGNQDAGVRALAVDPSDNLLVAGSFSGGVGAVPHQLSSAGMTDGFVFKLTSDRATTLWARGFGGPEADKVDAVAADAQRVLAGGEFAGMIELAGTSYVPRMTDAFVVKLLP